MNTVQTASTVTAFFRDFGVVVIGAGSLIVSAAIAWNQIATRRLQREVVAYQKETRDLQGQLLALSHSIQEWNEKRLSPEPVVYRILVERVPRLPGHKVTVLFANPGDVPVYLGPTTCLLKLEGGKVLNLRGVPKRGLLAKDAGDDGLTELGARAAGLFAYRVPTEPVDAERSLHVTALQLSLVYFSGGREAKLRTADLAVEADTSPSNPGEPGVEQNWLAYPLVEKAKPPGGLDRGPQ